MCRLAHGKPHVNLCLHDARAQLQSLGTPKRQRNRSFLPSHLPPFVTIYFYATETYLDTERQNVTDFCCVAPHKRKITAQRGFRPSSGTSIITCIFFFQWDHNEELNGRCFLSGFVNSLTCLQEQETIVLFYAYCLLQHMFSSLLLSACAFGALNPTASPDAVEAKVV